jgi:hypothetical protein
MVQEGWSWRWAVIAALCVVSSGCGGKSTPTAPTVAATPTPTPAPTPTPRQTSSLDAAGDFVQYTPPMARITAPAAYEFTATPLRINQPNPSSFAHTFEVWLSISNEVLANSSLGFSLVWLGNNHWSVDSYSPAGSWYHSRTQFDLPLGQTVTVRVTKHAAGIAELFINGVSMHSIEDTEPSRFLTGRVVGTATDFNFFPTGLTGSGVTTPRSQPCLFCAPR